MYEKYSLSIYNLLKHKNHSNICIYGSKDIDKLSIIINSFKKIYKLNETQEITYKSLKYLKNNIYFLFNINSLHYKNKLDWLEIMKNIVETDNYFLEINKYIILNNYDKMIESYQNILKIIIEKYYNVKFIIISNKYTNSINAITSRFINIRIPLINNIDKWYIINEKFSNINFDDYFKNEDLNIEYIEHIINTNTLNYESFSKNIIIYIINYLTYKNNSNILNHIKEIVYLIKCSSIPLDYFINNLLNYLLEKNYSNNIKLKIIKLFVEVDIKIKKSYCKIITLEYLFLNIYKLIN